jgi:uncharacterized protein involved in outer membrane biogenesis
MKIKIKDLMIYGTSSVLVLIAIVILVNGVNSNTIEPIINKPIEQETTTPSKINEPQKELKYHDSCEGPYGWESTKCKKYDDFNKLPFDYFDR